MGSHVVACEDGQGKLGKVGAIFFQKSCSLPANHKLLTSCVLWAEFDLPRHVNKYDRSGKQYGTYATCWTDCSVFNASWQTNIRGLFYLLSFRHFHGEEMSVTRASTVEISHVQRKQGRECSIYTCIEVTTSFACTVWIFILVVRSPWESADTMFSA